MAERVINDILDGYDGLFRLGVPVAQPGLTMLTINDCFEQN